MFPYPDTTPHAGSLRIQLPKWGLSPLRATGGFLFKDSITHLNQKYLLFALSVSLCVLGCCVHYKRHCEMVVGGESLSRDAHRACLIQADILGRQDRIPCAKS